MQKKLILNSLSPSELGDVVNSLGEKPYRAAQLYKWLYSQKCASVEDMSDLPKSFRTNLSEMAEISVIKEVDRRVSSKDASAKFLFELPDGERIESVILRDHDRATACISTQVGCKMGCKFCTTAAIGFKRNLNTAEIVEQVRLLEEQTPLTNIVFMGMGEPLDNFEPVYKSLEILMNDNGYGYSHRRITVSTAGVTDKIRRLFNLPTPPHIAVSVNAPTQAIRTDIMPISKAYPLETLMDTIQKLPMQKRKRVTLEYVLIDGINDREQNAKDFLKLIKGLPVKVNLIRYNGGGVSGFRKPDEKNVLAFQKILVDSGVSTFIRKSLGADIFGACGQLSAQYPQN